MRQRSIFAIGLATSLTALAGGTLLGCEDGPSQTFTPAPANAGNLWNNGNPDASVTMSPAGFDAGFGSTSALQNCTADEQRLNWAAMLEQPIIPPLQFAGLNLAYDEKFDGITLQEAQKIHCTGNSLGPGGTSWGNNGEVAFFYTTSNYVVNALQLNLGYNGKMIFHQRVGSRFDPTGKIQYVMQLGQSTLKDGVVLEVNWQDFGADTVVNEIFNGLMATFGQDLVGGNVDDTNDCTQDGSCLVGGPASAPANGGECYMGFLPLEGLLILTDCTTSLQPTISIPIQMQQQYYLSEPYSYQASVATINSQGPTSLPRFNNQQDPANCFVQMGMDWKTYVQECIDVPLPGGSALDPVLQDAGLVGVTMPLTINTVNENKAYAAHTHDTETYQFNIVGVNLNWTDEEVESNPQAVVNDSDLPSVTDAQQALVNSWGSDLYDKGIPINDTVSGTFSGQGSGYVYREWARLVQNDLNAVLAASYPNNVIPPGSPGAGGTIYNHQIGDQACFVAPQAAFAAGCTGMEGLAIQVGRGFNSGDAADKCATTPAPICANYNAGSYFAGLFGAPGYGATVLRPGNDLSIFCQNPAGVNTTTDPLNGNCNAYELWEGALQQVQMVAGQGSLTNLPLQIADRRYYFRWYGIALIKYLKAYGINTSATAADVAAQTLDLESIFFDSSNDGGGSTYDQVEYIERTFMTNSSATYVGNSVGSSTSAGAVTVPASINKNPMDFAFGGDTLAANQRNTDWAKFMYRQENAMFQAMLENKADLPGSENNVNITNLAGSQLLQQNYGSYECATQWPNVTIPVPGGTAITGSWSDVCSGACPGWSSFYPLNCPNPPLLPAAAPGDPQTLQLDLNGSNAGLGLGGTNPRLSNYKSVWGNGAACQDPTLPNTPNSELNPTAPGNNPYNTTPCMSLNNGFSVPTGVGSVFAVGQRPTKASRISYVGATAANPNTGTSPNTLTAYVNIPNMPNPYNAITLTGQAAPTNIQVTIPWIGSYDGVGFSIPSPGSAGATEDKFWQTAQLDFSGILETYLLDVVPYQDPITHDQDGTLTVDAIEGDDFLGEAFLCQDVGQLTTPGTGDLLGAHMYDSAASILSWITNHPGSEDNCNIVVRYSIYNNYVDAITSMSAGVQLDINTGGGYGRVVGVIAFDPALSAAP
jgi:hypothetical protein